MERHDATIGVDTSALSRDRVTGWERMAEVIASTDGVCRLQPARVASGRWSNLALQLAWHHRGLRAAVTSSTVELVHAPTYPPPALPVPVCWTVFDDLVVGGSPQWARRGAAVWSRLGRRALATVDRVVTHTHSTRDDLLAAGADPSRLTVLAPCCPPLTAPTSAPAVVDAAGAPTSFPDEFVLAVGTLEARKRPDAAAAAAAALGAPIVFVGRHAATPATFGLDGGDVLFATAASDGELAWCYHQASALIAASAYEGIDLPVLEAASVGLPVLASDIAVHREVADSAGVLIADLADPGPRLAAVFDLPRTPVRLGATVDEFTAAHRELWSEVLERRAR